MSWDDTNGSRDRFGEPRAARVRLRLARLQARSGLASWGRMGMPVVLEGGFACVELRDGVVF